MKNDEITLHIIKRSTKNLTAYEILEEFQKIKKVHPMTVYRSLKNLIAHDVIHKLNLNKSYILCSHSHTKNQNTFIATCKKCGISEELLANLFSAVLKKTKSNNFDLSFFDLEILTNCKRCN